MTDQYWINDFFIDGTRNQITHNEHSQTVPPKALAVLDYLAQHCGRVVSQDELLNNVWADRVVSPNTLQRSIAQLRKALGDDGKGQTLIKTHAKQGYSLDADVRSHSTVHEVRATRQPNSHNALKNDHARAGKSSGVMWAGAIGMALLIATLIYMPLASQDSPSSKTPQLKLGNQTTITATDDKEFDASYSPDGNHIVFHRYLDKLCVNKIWAKNVNTQQERLLTENWGAYGRHSFSEDGKTLIFFASQACDQPVSQKQCFDLVSLNFEDALNTPQQAEVILQCKNSTTQNPQWISDNNIVFMQRHNQRWKLTNYSIKDDRSSDFFEIADGNLIDYAYSSRDKLFAITSIHNDGQHYLEILDAKGEMQSSHKIKYPSDISRFQTISPSFSANKEQLVFSTGKQLFTLSFDGQVEKVNTSFTDKTFQPVFHPSGKRLLMLKGPYDRDLVLRSIDDLESDTEYGSFERSNVSDNEGIFQPNGDLIAFRSERSGDEQVWISGNDRNPRQITDFPIDTRIRGMKWADDGNSLLLNVNNRLTQIHLNNAALQGDHNERIRTVSLSLPHPIIYLLQWDSNNNTALAHARIEGVFTLIEVDLISLEIIKLTDDTVLWAQKTSDGQLIYKDTLDQFWRPGSAEYQPIEILKNQATKTKLSVLKDDVIYSINEQNKLWRYDLNAETFEVLGYLGENVDYLSDVEGSKILMTIKVSAKKEVVEFSLED